MPRRTEHRTIEEVLDTVESLEELEGLVNAIRSPAHRGNVRFVSREAWARIARMRIEMERGDA